MDFINCERERKRNQYKINCEKIEELGEIISKGQYILVREKTDRLGEERPTDIGSWINWHNKKGLGEYCSFHKTFKGREEGGIDFI